MRAAEPKTALKSKIESGLRPRGMFVSCSDAAVTDIISDAGFDFVIVDVEHGPIGLDDAQHHVRAAEAGGTIPIIRVGEHSPNMIGRFLDLGFQGVILPHVQTAEDAIAFVLATKFAPEGIRGMCPANHAGRYRGRDASAFARREARELLVGVIVESPAGVDNVEEIAAVEGLDIVFFGPGDFSHEVGARDGWSNPIVRAAWDRVARATKREGKLLMTVLLSGADDAEQRFDEGADLVIVDVDLLLLQRAIEAAVGPKPKTGVEELRPARIGS
jgi:2-keto-3-deoxy-L-rhamnonate aldolase RhmA